MHACKNNLSRIPCRRNGARALPSRAFSTVTDLKGKASCPFGFVILAKVEAECPNFKVMTAYEANFPSRVVPEPLAG